MSMNEGSMTSGSMQLGSATSEMTTLRQDLQAQIDRLTASNDIATTGQIVPTLRAVQAILDSFDSRLRAIEGRGTRGDGHDAPSTEPIAPTADTARKHDTFAEAVYDGPKTDTALGRETVTGTTGVQGSTNVGNG